MQSTCTCTWYRSKLCYSAIVCAAVARWAAFKTPHWSGCIDLIDHNQINGRLLLTHECLLLRTADASEGGEFKRLWAQLRCHMKCCRLSLSNRWLNLAVYYHYDPVILAYLPNKTLHNQTKITISRRNYQVNPGFPSQGKIEVMWRHYQARQHCEHRCV